MKMIAFYLPQFHQIPENDKFWGTGFTEWVNVRKGKALYEDHRQPRVPLNKNYYNLLDRDTMKWQVDLANKYGIYGFCFYHYYFNGKKLLEKPIEMFLKDKNLNIHFCICWANESWSNTWANGNSEIIVEQKYGNASDWEKHFNYLLQFFKDERYICNNNKPLLVIYRPELITNLELMLNLWNKMAKQNGFDGIEFAYQNVSYYLSKNRNDQLFSYAIEYQPNWILALQNISKVSVFKKNVLLFFEKHTNLNLREKMQTSKKLKVLNYDKIWQNILNMKPTSNISVPGAFVDWDNTPRKGKRGLVIHGSTPEKFEKYLEALINKTKKEYKKDMIFIFAWNEWGEGGYLEPDEDNKYGYLEAIKKAIKITKEKE